MIQGSTSHITADTAIIGGGILGLWAARHAIRRGENVVLVDKRKLGSGASGGFLGALMPHMPDSWNIKKQLQYNGIKTLSKVTQELEEEVGLSCCFDRCGRIMPIPHEKLLTQVERRKTGAVENWDTQFELTQIDEMSVPKGWMNAEIAVHGIQYDTLSARISPRAYMRALEAYIRPRASIVEGVSVVGLNHGNNGVDIQLGNGEKISAGKAFVCNGWEAYPLLQPIIGNMSSGKPIGRGVKGQAVLLEYSHDDDLPIVYHDGSYIVPHSGNRVAIGSTSENNWQNGQCPTPRQFDFDNMGFYHKAVDLVPALKNAPVIEHWANVRPRNTLEGRGTSPWLGPVPDHENLTALIGGFKITFGIAHLDFFKEPFTD